MINEIQTLLIQIVRNNLFPDNNLYNTLENIECLTEDEARALLSEAQEQAVFPIVFASVNNYIKKIISEEEYKKYYLLLSAHYASVIRNINDHNELHRLLYSNQVPYVILKGQASASYYPKPMLRSAGDVDFLINESDLQKVNTLLINEGYFRRKGALNHGFHWIYHKKNRTSLEMHWAVPGIPLDNKTIEKYFSNIFDDSVIYEKPNESYMIPSRFHHGLVLILHTLSHMTITGIGLRHLCDWLIFENSFSEEEFISVFESPLKDIGVWKFTQVFTRIGILYFGCNDRNWCKEVDEGLCSEIFEDILTSGNFGVKDRGRKRIQAKLIRNSFTSRIENGRILKNIAVNINALAKKKYPIARKYPMLVPIGWIKVGVQYFRWIQSGKGKAIDRDVYGEAIKRQEMYAKLKLFEK